MPNPAYLNGYQHQGKSSCEIVSDFITFPMRTVLGGRKITLVGQGEIQEEKAPSMAKRVVAFIATVVLLPVGIISGITLLIRRYTFTDPTGDYSSIPRDDAGGIAPSIDKSTVKNPQLTSSSPVRRTRSVAASALAISPSSLSQNPEPLEKCQNRDTVIAVLKANPNLRLNDLHPVMRSDKEVVKICVNRNGLDLEYANEELKKSSLAYDAVQDNPEALKFCLNKQFVLFCIKANKVQNMNGLHEIFHQDEEVIKAFQGIHTPQTANVQQDTTVHLTIKGKNYDISKSALDNIYRFLGGNDLSIGKQRFYELLKDGKIDIQNIDYNKSGNPKTYLLVDPGKGAERGAFNDFRVGFSPRGNPRALIKQQHDEQWYKPFQSNLEHFKKTMKSHANDPRMEYISRIMGMEGKFKATQLGGVNLKEFFNRKDLSEEDFLAVFEGVFNALELIHEMGFVHKDLNPGNIVVAKKNGKIEVKLIDWDLVGGGFEGEVEHYWQGNPDYLPVELTNQALQFAKEKGRYESDGVSKYQAGWAKSSQDIWAIMCNMCEMGLKAQTKDKLFSPAFLERFQDYRKAGGKSADGLTRTQYENRQAFLAGKTNLFEGLEPKTRMDKLVFLMASTNPEERASATKLLEEMRKQ